MFYITHQAAIFFSRSKTAHRPKPNIFFITFLTLSLSLLSACGGGGSNSGGGEAPKGTSISGYVIDGPISNSSVTLHLIGPEGTPGEQVAGPFVTDENGAWSGQIPAGQTGFLMVVATGGHYTDDATGDLITLETDETLFSWYDTENSTGQGVVSPITDSLWQMVQQGIKQGDSVADSVDFVRQTAYDFWGLNPTDVVPDITSGSNAEQRYGVFLATFSFLMKNNEALQLEPFVSMPRFTLMRLLMDDLADGRLDGYDLDDQPILTTDGTPLPVLSTNDLSAFFNEANAYAEVLQIGVVEEQPDRIHPTGAFCPSGGLFMYSRDTANSPATLVVDRSKSKIISSSTTSPIGETLYIDSYQVAFKRSEYIFQFTVASTHSKGSTLTNWMMNLGLGVTSGFIGSYEPEMAYQAAGGRIVFKKDTPFGTFSPVSRGGKAYEGFVCGNFSLPYTGTNPHYFPPAVISHKDTYLVGGFISGLTGTITLQNNGDDNLVVGSNGRFSFPTQLSDRDFYNFSILKQPNDETCTLSNSAGQMGVDHIFSPRVTCIDNPGPNYNLGGRASGVIGTMILRNDTGGLNPSEVGIVAGQTSFTFPEQVAPGDDYNVIITGSQSYMDCSLQNASGTMGETDVTDVALTCTRAPTATYTIGGSVSGLVGNLQLSNSSSEVINISANGNFQFSNPVNQSGNYSVWVSSPPTGQNCSVSNGSGTVDGSNISNIQITCEDTYSLGGSVSGLNGILVLRSLAGDKTITQDGTFTFNTGLPTGSSYTVTITSAPATQTCSVSSGGSGTVGTIDVTTVQISCTDKTGFTVGGTISNLNGSVVLTNAGEELSLSANGSFAFNTLLQTGNTYDVRFKTQPANQICTINNSTFAYGTIGSENVTTLQVNCVDSYTLGGTVSGLSGTLRIRAYISSLPTSYFKEITSDGAFSFNTSLAVGITYRVAVIESPAGQNCNIMVDQSGSMANANITSVDISCSDNQYTLGGRVSGLNGTLTLQNNLLDNLTISTNGAFTFSNTLTSASAYDVTVLSSPAAQACNVTTGGNGTSGMANIRSVAVQCSSTSDTANPVITLNGPASVNVAVGAVYMDAGATALDDVDGDISASLVINNPADTSTLGNSFQVTYNVTDAAEKPAIQVSRSVTVVASVAQVGAFYSNAANWNDYVKNDGTSRFNAANIAAEGTETGGYYSVIHGGEMRVVDSGEVSCTNQTATDALGVFNWICDDSSGSALLVSTGFKEGRHLSNLLDFSTPAWLNNSVTVSGSGAALPFSTPASQWWTNPVLNADAGGTLSTAGTVYVVTQNPSAAITTDADKVALVIQPGVTFSVSSGNAVSAASDNYLWFEGAINGSSASLSGGGVYWNRIKYSVIRNANVMNATNGIELNTSANNKLEYISVTNNFNGIQLYSDWTSLLNTVSANNRSDGMIIAGTNNHLSKINVSNNARYGIYLLSAQNTSLLNVSLSSNNYDGIALYNASNNISSNITAASNGVKGLNLNQSSNNILSSVASVNNGASYSLLYPGSDGINAQLSSGNSLLNIISDNLYFYGPNSNTFSGLLKVVNSCFVDANEGVPAGIDSVTCTNNGSSNAVFSSPASYALSFIGKVDLDDALNSSNLYGSAGYPSDPLVFDWTRFENIYRSWGLDGGAFINIDKDNVGQWNSGTGRIWDWSLSANDTGIVRNVITTIPTGNDTYTHTWSDTSTITYLRNATEIQDDFIGNDNGLCESNESCLFTPNIGSYQGHGSLISAGAFTDGTLTGITLMKYSSNGY